MPKLLTSASSMMCPHGGTITATPSHTQARAGAAILSSSDSFVIAGCTFALPSGTLHPCASVQWVQTGLKVKHGGDFALNESSVGLCLAGDQAPQGTVTINSTQPAVAGL